MMKIMNRTKIVSKIFGFAACVVIAAACAGTGFAQKQTPPEGGSPKPFVFPKQNTYTLKNGMKVTLVQYGSVPKVLVQAVVRAGRINEKPGEVWISDMVASMLKQGTKTRSAEQIAREMADMGGEIFTGGGNDKSVVGGEVLSEFDARSIALIADVLRNPRFSAEDLEDLRANDLRNLSVSMAQAGNVGWKAFRETIYKGHPYAEAFAGESDIKGYTLDGVKKFYDDQYGAARTHLYVVGQFDESAVKKAIEAGFASWKKGPDAIRNVPKIDAKRSMTVLDRPGAPQSTLYIGMPSPSPSDPDWIKFSVMNAMLGGSFGSRITANIRENKGYTYSPHSAVTSAFKTGYWYENADVTTQYTGASIKEILAEIDKLSGEEPTDAELQGIKNYMIGIYVLQNSTRSGVVGQLESVNYNELGSDYIDTYVKNISEVTPKDVRDMAAKYLKKDKMTIVVVGDKAKITDQLKPYEN